MSVGTTLPDALKSISAPTVDFNAAKFDASYVQQLQQQAAAATSTAKSLAEKQFLATASAVKRGNWFRIVLWIVGIIGLILLIIVLYDTFAPDNWINIFFDKSRSLGGGSGINVSNATYGSDDNYVDVTSSISSMLSGGNTIPSFKVGAGQLNLNANPDSKKLNTLKVTWSINGGVPQQTNINENSMFPELSGAGGPAVTNTQAPPPTWYSKLFGASSSGDLIKSPHDGSSAVTIKGTRAPLSSESEGAYGMQWWMFVKDWNYGYGKKKGLVLRTDPTNNSVTNPEISLHPTDNTLDISISIFPSSEGSSKSQPAAAGHSGSTDDVFVCSVPNIPLQTWFSVSVTVFGRNVDVYIDGKLVKSCFLPGVPKPAAGDIQLTSGGGFSGKVCSFYHYPRMLNPVDALNFWSTGTVCSTLDVTSSSAATTGYSVKFGVYDSLGKEVQEYSF
jgi:hypothetical protein